MITFLGYGVGCTILGMLSGYWMSVMNRREAARCWAECKRLVSEQEEKRFLVSTPQRFFEAASTVYEERAKENEHGK